MEKEIKYLKDRVKTLERELEDVDAYNTSLLEYIEIYKTTLIDALKINNTLSKILEEFEE